MAKRQVFYSFHYSPDNWRASQVKNIGILEGNPIASSNEWEEVKRKGESGIKSWIDRNMTNRSCVVVLIGAETASRKWVNYEIEKAWKDGRGIVGIYIHGLKNTLGNQSKKGDNPFDNFCIDTTFNYIVKNTKPADANECNLAKICKTYDPPYSSSEYVYDYIKNNIEKWIEEAIKIRNTYPI